MSNLFEADEHATPLMPDERSALRQPWITFRHELNEAEQANIVKAMAWARRKNLQNLLTDDFARMLHKRMFGDVWSWAGQYRTTPRNLGVEAHRIAPEVRGILDDAGYWCAQGTFEPDEIAVRLHHRLVSVHPFANGNGRHTRLMADLLIVHLGGQQFLWGRSNLRNVNDVRSRYILALQAADDHDIAPLLAFARSR